MRSVCFTKIFFSLAFILFVVTLKGQYGLENILVEKYYVADAADASGSIGTLPAGSVTYRIYADMLPGYEFQMAWGDSLADHPHPLFINTTTSFFNNEDRGNTNPTYTKAQAKNNTVMLDSWLSAGAACVGNFGVLKPRDDSVATIENADGILQNNDISAGIPLSEQDGMIAGAPGAFGSIGIDEELSVFDATSLTGNSFLIYDGAWYCLEGITGPDSDNQVLIAQVTTDGQLSFDLNIQLGTPTGEIEKYVANDPVFDGVQEIKLPFLKYKPTELNGLQNVLIEKYYVSNEADSIKSSGTLPVGSVTYRVFADMLPGYKFYKAYGSANHTLFFNTTTSFFNNEDKGNTTPSYTKTDAGLNTVMLDSWLSAGAACSANFGMLKSDDNGVATIENTDGILQNNDTLAGIPLTQQDGVISGSPELVSLIGLEPEVSNVFGNVSQSGNSLTVTNGYWFCLNGSQGPDADNNVLIAQLTTDGRMSFELNIELLTPSGDTQLFVAKNPVASEIVLTSLTYTSPIYSGINQNLQDEPVFTVFPNPAKDIISLSISSNFATSCSYTIYDLTGNELISQKTDKSAESLNEQIDLSSFSNGVYFIRVTIDGKSSIKKLIKN